MAIIPKKSVNQSDLQQRSDAWRLVIGKWRVVTTVVGRQEGQASVAACVGTAGVKKVAVEEEDVSWKPHTQVCMFKI